ncbi:hypothetical protein [Tabrizicola oligotrophica]|uniref:Uncharacterized protein n=1 Tax=Tabrizicola oligotrophica TaxID=2710650 RepID=A0A6M0QZN7_9RHOB|nr:hypothetical protein [Tabrizicola oligotrophica]NEY92012.1 hypothetical protein [Tabrizicola oligotrophica]
MIPHLMVMADGNYLRDERLRTYLSAHSQHWLVLSDLTLVEMFKKNALGTARASLKILADFPDQIFALKPAYLWLDAKVRSEADLQQLVDLNRSADLRQLSRAYKSDEAIHGFADRMKARETEASEYIRQLRGHAETLEGSLQNLLKEFRAEELKQIRTAQGVTGALQEKIFNLVDEVTVEFVRANHEPGRTAPLKRSEAHGMFAYRYALCVVIAFTRWVALGRQAKSLDLWVNDVVDNQIAATSTFFNEILTKDRELQIVASNARDVLKHLRAFVRPFPGEALASGNG